MDLADAVTAGTFAIATSRRFCFDFVYRVGFIA